MRWIRYTSPQGGTRYGQLHGEVVHAVDGDPLIGYELRPERYALADVRLEIPVVPVTFYAAGLNYAAHVKEGATLMDRAPVLPTQADIGYRANNALIAHGEDVIIPADAGPRVHYEGELVVVIGRKAHKLTEDEALSCVLGYTIGNDVSERDWQKQDRTFWRAKNTDTFKPMGPWIDTEFDFTAATTIVRLNGQEQHRFPTNDMIFGVRQFISRMSQYLTLWPGDVIWMGTDGTSPDLRSGDEVEVEITGLGRLRNRFMRASQ
jgi:2-keto-4-pentenoate hydratase/2-oxohepta-3-ene-1,7-dioic acid hydratase in catechol pathway